MKYLVLDIGGSSIKYALITEALEFIRRGEKSVPKENFEDLIEIIGELYDQYKHEIEGIAISFPGEIDSNRGYCYNAGSLSYSIGKEIKTILEERCPTKISIENDGNCAALAELWKGSLKECKDAIVIVLGTNIGGGIIIDKKIYKGKQCFAGGFTFVSTNNSFPCEYDEIWGRKNGTERLTGALSHLKKENLNEVNGYSFFEYANNGDEEVLEILDKFTQTLVVQIFNLQVILSPEKIAIGGGISAQNILMNYIHKNIDEYYRNLKFSISKPEILRCEFKNDANLIGALYNLIYC
ncbi:ROK family protein [Clostridium saccharoperbutylacetonicum]|uniref:ROK family protein n=1 Tax=Clostridium saccharoperbutylacetonicum TaxID=36745 RepID=UPI0039EA200E